MKDEFVSVEKPMLARGELHCIGATTLNGIVDLLIADLNKRLKDKQVNVKVSDNAKQFIIDSAYDPTYGARPLKRFIQSKIETLLARAIIGGNVEPETTLEIDCENSALVIK